MYVLKLHEEYDCTVDEGISIEAGRRTVSGWNEPRDDRALLTVLILKKAAQLYVEHVTTVVDHRRNVARMPVNALNEEVTVTLFNHDAFALAASR